MSMIRCEVGRLLVHQNGTALAIRMSLGSGIVRVCAVSSESFSTARTIQLSSRMCTEDSSVSDLEALAREAEIYRWSQRWVNKDCVSIRTSTDTQRS